MPAAEVHAGGARKRRAVGRGYGGKQKQSEMVMSFEFAAVTLFRWFVTAKAEASMALGWMVMLMALRYAVGCSEVKGCG